MLKGKVKQAILAYREQTRQLPVRQRIQAFLAIDAESLASLPGVKWLRNRQMLVKHKLRSIDNPHIPVAEPWVTRSKRWTDKERAVKRFHSEFPKFQTQCYHTIVERGGETSIAGNYRENHIDVTDLNITDKLCVYHAEGWRKYGSRYPARYAQLSYFCGLDDSGYFAVRIQGTVKTVKEAIDWLMPSAVKKAIEKGKQIIRQGDIYAVETLQRCDGSGLELLDRHEWDAESRTLTHPEHEPIKIDFPCRFYRQRSYEMGRTSARGWAD